MLFETRPSTQISSSDTPDYTVCPPLCQAFFQPMAYVYFASRHFQTLASGPCPPFSSPMARRSQLLWYVLISVCQIVLDDGPCPGIEEGHLFQASSRALITDAPGQLKDAQARPLQKR